MKNSLLGEIKAKLDVTQERLAAAMGCNVDRVKSLLGGKAAHLRPAEIAGLVNEFHLNPEYFIKQGAAMLASEVDSKGLPSSPGRTEPHQPPYDAETKDWSAYIQVPHYGVHASAGNGSVVHEENVVDHLVFKRDWVVRNMGLDPRALALIDVRGDSMSPTINDGDLILLDTREGQQTTEGIYAINLAGGLLVKRLRLRLSGAVEVISDNERYGTETISGDQLAQLHIVGRVVWQGRRI